MSEEIKYFVSAGADFDPETLVTRPGGLIPVKLKDDLKPADDIIKAARLQAVKEYKAAFEQKIRAKRQPTPLPPHFKHADVVLFADVLETIRNFLSADTELSETATWDMRSNIKTGSAPSGPRPAM